mgnify:FL=1
MVNADKIISSIIDIADKYFDQHETEKREEFKTQLFCTKIRELSALLNSVQSELNSIKETL